MRLAYRLSWAAALSVVFVSSSFIPTKSWAKEEGGPSVGTKLDEYTLQDFRGKSHSLSDSKEAKLVVVAFLGVECPLSKLYGPRLAELAREFEPQGVTFVAVDANRQDSVTEMGHFAK